MKISVIVPVFNTEKFLEKCLTSLVNQTFKDLEIICVNDGSTDNSLKILEEFAKDERVKIINQQTAGPSVARNNGIKEAIGEYIGFVDSDDWVDLDFFEKLYNAIEENNTDIACAPAIRERKIVGTYRVNYTESKIYNDLEERIQAINFPKCSYVWNKLYRAEKIRNIAFKEGVLYEDMIWIPKVLLETNSLVTVCDTNYHYRANPNSIVKCKPCDKKQKDYYEAQKEVIKFFEDNNLFLSEHDKHVIKWKKYFGKVLIMKIKEYKYTEIYYLFGFIPFLRITRYPELEGYNG